MKLIGKWWDSSLAYEQYAPPQELVGTWPPDRKSIIAEYLYFNINEIDLLYRMSFATLRRMDCEFGCGADWTATKMHIGDDEWAWPIHLHHHVECHDVVLPEDFVQYVINSSRTPRLLNHQEISQPDSAFWLEWVLSNRNYSERSSVDS